MPGDSDHEDRRPQQLLFDLPLEPTVRGTGDPAERGVRGRGRRRVAAEEEAGGEAVDGSPPRSERFADDRPAVRERELDLPLAPPPGAAVGSPTPSLAGRAVAALIDLGVHVALAILTWVGVELLGLRWVAPMWPATVIFLLAFSMVYTVVPLALWGQTPGLALRRLRAGDAAGRPPSFGAATGRWAGSLLTLLLVGLPALLEPPLADRLSGTRLTAA